MTDTKIKVCLIAMPFIPIESPCHSLGLLKSYFKQLNVHCEVKYLNLHLAEKIGVNDYNRCGNPYFAEAAFGNDVEPFNEPSLSHIPKQTFPDYIEDCLESYDWSQYDLVLFTTALSLSTTASFAFARRLKERYNVLTGIGGSGMYWGAGEEYIKIPWIDYIFTGHVDADSLSNLVQAIETGNDKLYQKIPDLCRYVDGKVIMSTAKFVPDMDKVPVPDYADFFEQLNQQSFADSPEIKASLHYGLLYAEFGRGCFYGDSQTCSFCSEVDIQKSNHRSYENGIQYLTELSETYPEQANFFFTEPLMGRTLQDKIFPAWNKIRPKHQRYVCEVKPWMSRAEIKALGEYGVVGVQCGIEAFHPNLIKLLKKGQKQHTCIAALKWFKTYNIHVFWNILIQIPGENQQDHIESSKLLPSLRHLPKPAINAYPIFLTRGTPYWEERDKWQFENLRPHDGYRYLIPNWLDLEAACFCWEYDIQGRCNMEVWQEGHLALQQEMNKWYEQDYVLELSGHSVTDSRFGTVDTHQLTDEQRDCLVFCDTPKNADQLTQFAEDAMEYLISNKLLLKSEHKFISLPIISDQELYLISPRTEQRRVTIPIIAD